MATTTFEITRNRLADLLAGKEVKQGGQVITLGVGTETIRQLCDDADADPVTGPEAEDEGEGEDEEEAPKPKRTAKKKAAPRKRPAK